MWAIPCLELKEMGWLAVMVGVPISVGAMSAIAIDTIIRMVA
jgi:hypothetical protein